MTFTIGRASFGCGPYGLRHAGDRLSFGLNIDGQSTGGDLDAAKALRQQLLGMDRNADEPVVPLTWSGDADLDGFYRVLDVQVDPFDTYLDAGQMQCRLGLERVGGGFARAAMETLILAPGRTTDHTNAHEDNSYLVGVPHDLDYVEPGPTDAEWVSTFQSPVESADGDLLLLARNASLPAATSYVFRTYARPDRHYRGAATIEVLRDGVWFVVVGRQLPAGTTRWRISNGLFRLSMSTTIGRATCEIYDPDTNDYETIGDLRRLIITSEVDFGTVDLNGTAYVDPVILRNDPTTVVVRVPKASGGYETFRLQSGRWAVDIEIVHYADAALSLRFGETGTALSTFSTSYGIVRSSNDSNGNRWFIGCASDVTEDTTNGGITLSVNASQMLAVVGGYGTTTLRPDADASISVFLLGHSLSQRVVAR